MLGRIAGKGLDFYIIIEFFFVNLAWILTLAVPMAVLIAVLMAFGRMSSENEITALKASGVSIFQLLKPTIMFGIIIGLILFWFNDQMLPKFNHRARLLKTDIARKMPTMNIQEGVFIFDVPNIVLKAAKVNNETSRLVDVVIFDESDRKYITSILAEEGELAFSYEDEKFLLTLYDGSIHRMERRDESSYQETRFETAIFRFDVPNLLLERRESSYRGDRELTSAEMMAKVKEMKAADPPNQSRINVYLVEINKKFSIPAACIVFTLIGVPLGIMFRAGGLGVSGGVSVFFFLLYWICLIGGEDLADNNTIPPWLGMWSANIIITGLAVLFITRNLKGYSMLDLANLKRILPKKWRREHHK